MRFATAYERQILAVLTSSTNKTHFRQLQHTLDDLFHKLHSEGVGVQVKTTEVLTKEDEANLWNCGVMGVTTPKTLQNAAFYVVSKMFALRGGIEHQSLKLSQVKRMKNPDHLWVL